MVPRIFTERGVRHFGVAGQRGRAELGCGIGAILPAIWSSGASTSPRSAASGIACIMMRSRKRSRRSIAKRRQINDQYNALDDTQERGTVTDGRGVDGRVDQCGVGDAQERQRARVGDAFIARSGEELVEDAETVARGAAAIWITSGNTSRATTTPSGSQMLSRSPRITGGAGRRNG